MTDTPTNTFWLLGRLDKVHYDEFKGFVVLAPSEESARLIACKSCADEGSHVWMDKDLSSCESMTVQDRDGVVLSSFNAG